MNGDAHRVGPPESEEVEAALREEAKQRRFVMIATTVSFVGVAVVIRLLRVGGLGQTGLMFIGLPALMAIGLSFVPKSRTVTGNIMRTMTFVLLLLGILLIEGFICILMAAPLFYVIGLVVGICADRKRVREDMTRFRCTVAGVLGMMALEGVVPRLSFGRENVVVIEREVAGSVAEVREQVLGAPELAVDRLPGFLRLGFPVPAGIERVGGEGWLIRFEEGKEEATELRVGLREEGPGRVRYVMGEDSTKISEWLTWHDGLWELEEAGAGRVRARLTVRYRRELDPYWYFAPLERYGVRKAAGYFADEVLRGEDDEA